MSSYTQENYAYPQCRVGPVAMTSDKYLPYRVDFPPEPDGPVPGGPVPNGPVPNGPVPNGPVPNGPVPNGPVPNGPVPDGPVPNGPVPDGPVPDGAKGCYSKPYGAWQWCPPYRRVPNGPIPSRPPPVPRPRTPPRRPQPEPRPNPMPNGHVGFEDASHRPITNGPINPPPPPPPPRPPPPPYWPNVPNGYADHGDASHRPITNGPINPPPPPRPPPRPRTPPYWPNVPNGYADHGDAPYRRVTPRPPKPPTPPPPPRPDPRPNGPVDYEKEPYFPKPHSPPPPPRPSPGPDFPGPYPGPDGPGPDVPDGPGPDAPYPVDRQASRKRPAPSSHFYARPTTRRRYHSKDSGYGSGEDSLASALGGSLNVFGRGHLQNWSARVLAAVERLEHAQTQLEEICDCLDSTGGRRAEGVIALRDLVQDMQLLLWADEQVKYIHREGVPNEQLAHEAQQILCELEQKHFVFF